MSLGLFNCRLIQPAGDQLFFFSAALPRRCQFRQALFSLLVTRPARPRPTGGRRMLLVFPSQKDFVLVFRGAKSPRAQKGSLPTIHPRISPKIPQSYPQIPLQTRQKQRPNPKPRRRPKGRITLFHKADRSRIYKSGQLDLLTTPTDWTRRPALRCTTPRQHRG